MTWLLTWGVPALIVLAIVLLAWFWNDVKRLPYRRFEKPMWGTNGLYLPESWKPKVER